MKMNTQTIIVGLLFVIALASVSEANGSRKKTQNILNKMEAYAQDSEGTATLDLTIQELEEAYLEFEEWDEPTRKKLIEFTPLMQLLIDFLFYPMERFHALIGDSPAEHQAYIDRFAANYKRFRPSYLGEVVGNKVPPNPKTTRLIESLAGINKPHPLTIKMIRDAKIEYDSFVAKMREIPDFEDVYADLDNLMLYRNYYNQPEVGIMGKQILPALPQITEDKLPALKQFFMEELKKKNIMVYNGQLTRFVYQ